MWYSVGPQILELRIHLFSFQIICSVGWWLMAGVLINSFCNENHLTAARELLSGSQHRRGWVHSSWKRHFHVVAPLWSSVWNFFLYLSTWFNYFHEKATLMIPLNCFSYFLVHQSGRTLMYVPMVVWASGCRPIHLWSRPSHYFQLHFSILIELSA